MGDTLTVAALRNRVLDWLSDQVPPTRIQHILGVEQMALDLAQHYGLDQTQAQIAGLMHDLAKYFKPDLLLRMAQQAGLEIDSVLEMTPHLLHADISAMVAREEFGIQDPEILQAIANHTLGRPGMSLLSCVVFLADSLELGRGNTAELESLRQMSQHNLHQALWHTCDYSLKHLLKGHCLIHPRTILTRNWSLQMTRKGNLGTHPPQSATTLGSQSAESLNFQGKKPELKSI